MCFSMEINMWNFECKTKIFSVLHFQELINLCLNTQCSSFSACFLRMISPNRNNLHESFAWLNIAIGTRSNNSLCQNCYHTQRFTETKYLLVLSWYISSIQSIIDCYGFMLSSFHFPWMESFIWCFMRSARIKINISQKIW